MKIGDNFDGGKVTKIESPSLDKENENVKDVTVCYDRGGGDTYELTHVVNTVTQSIIYANVRG